ncbi:phosphoglycerate kinase [Salvia divinorum]|uniref:Phosphoglycerate kinase n=1 Tax=Salvia divinorum TaxID=28513 RepID=A0ABD1GZ18_SALDI
MHSLIRGSYLEKLSWSDLIPWNESANPKFDVEGSLSTKSVAGSMAFQMMLALGTPAPIKLVETGTLEEAVRIVEIAEIQIASVHSIPQGWQPVDIEPRSLEEIA